MLAAEPLEVFDYQFQALSLDQLHGIEDVFVIVSDLEQPARDGLALAATIRGGTRWRATPMVAVSDRASPRDQVRGRLAGFDDHVAKSDRKALLSALEDTLNRARGAV